MGNETHKVINVTHMFSITWSNNHIIPTTLSFNFHGDTYTISIPTWLNIGWYNNDKYNGVNMNLPASHSTGFSNAGNWNFYTADIDDCK